MKITRKNVAQKIIDYLHHRITLADLVDWAESMMMEADFESHRDDMGRLRKLLITSRIPSPCNGYREFWEDSS